MDLGASISRQSPFGDKSHWKRQHGSCETKTVLQAFLYPFVAHSLLGYFLSSNVVDPLHPWPIMFFGTYSSSKYFASSSVNILPLTCNASSILSTLLNPMIGLLTPLCRSHDIATWLIAHPFFLASSSTRPMVFPSASDNGELPVDRVVVPLTLSGRARLPCARGPH